MSTIPAISDLPPGTGTTRPRVIVFGPPGCGKTTLTHAIRAAAGNGSGMAAADCDADLHDCDGQAVRELLGDPAQLLRHDESPELAGAVRTGDSLVLIIDATSTPEQVSIIFRSFAEFLNALVRCRTFGRDVGGLPVFLVLTKCDALSRPDDTPADWLARIGQRKRELVARFADHFRRDSGEPFLPFGSVDLRPVAVAIRTPNRPEFRSHADPSGTFGIADFTRQLLPSARRYRERLGRSRSRLRLTVSGVVGVVTSLVLGLLVVEHSSDDPLAVRIHDYRSMEGPPAVRLSDRNITRNRKELAEIRSSPGFGRLPVELRKFVDGRYQEIEAYRQYRDRFRPPRLGPAEVRTRAELGQLEAALVADLSPPEAYAVEWSAPGAQADAVRLWEKWKADARLLADAEERVYEWFRGLAHRANLFSLIDTPPDFPWRNRISTLLSEADAPPFRPADPIPGSVELPTRRGEVLTYLPAFEFDRIDAARRDWLAARDRLVALRDLCDALGLTSGADSPPPVLDLPEPGAGVDSLHLASARLAALTESFPAAAPDFRGWSPERFSDPVWQWLEPRVRAEFETGVRHVRQLLGERLTNDRPEDWRGLANGLLTEPPLRDWGTLLSRLRQWSDPTAPDMSPVEELAVFLKADRFHLTPGPVDLSIPDDLLGDRLTPAGNLVVRFTPVSGSPVEWFFRQDGEGRYDRPRTTYRFVPNASYPPFVFRPGDGCEASLPARAGGRDYRLRWVAARSSAYRFDALGQFPMLERLGPMPASERAVGLRLVFPGGGIPAVPVLIPAVSPASP